MVIALSRWAEVPPSAQVSLGPNCEVIRSGLNHANLSRTLAFQSSAVGPRFDERLDRLAIVRDAVAVGYSVQVDRAVEDAAGLDASFEHVRWEVGWAKLAKGRLASEAFIPVIVPIPFFVG